MRIYIRQSVRWLPAALVLLAGCTIDSDAPLSDPDKAKIDEKVLGRWIGKHKDGFVRHILVEKMSAAGYPAAVMKLTLGIDDKMYGLIFCSELNGKTYVNLCGEMVDDPAKIPTWEKARPFGIMKYAIEGKTLSLWEVADESPLKDAIAKGKLKGRHQRAQFGPTFHITDTTAKLAQVVADGDDKLFSETKKAVFGR